MSQKLAGFDPQIAEIIQKETARQEYNLEFIASENFVSEHVLEVQGSVLTNKYAEGYPGKRYYGGCEFVDEAEQLAKDLGLDALCIHAGPVHVKLARGFKLWTTSIIRQFKE